MFRQYAIHPSQREGFPPYYRIQLTRVFLQYLWKTDERSGNQNTDQNVKDRYWLSFALEIPELHG